MMKVVLVAVLFLACAFAEDTPMSDEQIAKMTQEEAKAITEEQWIEIFRPRCQPKWSWKWKSQYFADPRNCNGFFQCVWFRPVWQSCPAGLNFNSKLNVCDYPDRAGCRWWRPPRN